MTPLPIPACFHVRPMPAFGPVVWALVLLLGLIGSCAARAGDASMMTEVLSAGEDHTCAVKAGGTVTCWGYRSVPADLGQVNQVSVGGSHACAVKADGVTVCWGYNAQGQTDVPADLGPVSQVSAGGFHTCAVKANGTVACWGVKGNYDYGQTLPPADLGPVSQVSAGGFHTCAVKANGAVACWGGDEVHGESRPPADLGFVSQVSAGVFYTCAVKANSTVACWGLGGYGSAEPPANLGLVSQVSAGSQHTCAVKANGGVACWGSNDYGRATPPADLRVLGQAQVAAGALHSLLLQVDGSLLSWGDNSYGQLGDGASTAQSRPGPVDAATDWYAIGAGGQHSLALKQDGSLWAWGKNDHGQLGDGTVLNRNQPVRIGGDTDWVTIAAGGQSNLALKRDYSLWAWGMNLRGTLGDGTTTDRTSPVRVGSNYRALSADAHVLAIKTDGSLWAWGTNEFGQVGDGSTTDRKLPVQIGVDKDWWAVAAGSRHSLALKQDGSLWAWGRNTFGQLGDGTTTQRVTPVRIGVATDWRSVHGAVEYSLALQHSSALWAWGSNTWGGLGDGTTTQRKAPVPIGLDTDWIRVDASNHSLALKRDGSVWAWGWNASGQLGTGDTTNRTSPVRILGKSTSMILTAGSASVRYGESITLTATVAATTPAGDLPTGKVSFLDGATALGQADLAKGVASLTINTLSIGEHAITARYEGDDLHAGSTAAPLSLPVTQGVQADLVVTADPAALTLGGTSTLSATGGSTGGTVTYTAKATPGLTCAISGATLTASGAPGVCTVTGEMAGNDNYLPVVSAGLAIPVTSAVGTALTASATQLTYGDSVTLTAMVSGNKPTGTVGFYAGDTLLATRTLLQGRAVLQKVFAAGAYSLTARYSGDGNNPPSQSAPVNLTVVQAEQAPLVLTATPTQLISGGKATLKATGGTGAGAITYAASGTGGVACKIAANVLTAQGGPGQCVVTATKAGNANYLPVTSNTVAVDVAFTPVSVGLTAAPVDPVYGQPLSFTATVTGNNPTGTVAFLEGTTQRAKVLLKNGQAAYTSQTLPAGAHTLVARYLGDPNDAATNSEPVTVTIAQAEQAPLALNVTPTQLISGGKATLKATGGTGAGAIRYTATPEGAVTCAITANVLTARGGPGRCVITATKLGNANYQPVTSNTVAVDVAFTPVSVGLTAAPATPVYGQKLSFTATVTGNNPTGSVAFLEGTTQRAKVPLAGGRAVYTSQTLPAGAHTLVAKYLGDANDAATQSEPVTVTIAQAEQTPLTLTATPDHLVSGDDGAQLAVSGGSGPGGLTWTVTASGASVCKITLAKVLKATGGAGACEVSVTRAGSDNYRPASTTLSVPVSAP